MNRAVAPSVCAKVVTNKTDVNVCAKAISIGR